MFGPNPGTLLKVPIIFDEPQFSISSTHFMQYQCSDEDDGDDGDKDDDDGDAWTKR